MSTPTNDPNYQPGGVVGSGSPAYGAMAVTKSDSVSLPPGCRGLYVGGAGNLYVLMADGVSDDIAIMGATAGSYHPIRVLKVKAATTATNIVALY